MKDSRIYLDVGSVGTFSAPGVTCMPLRIVQCAVVSTQRDESTESEQMKCGTDKMAAM